MQPEKLHLEIDLELEPLIPGYFLDIEAYITEIETNLQTGGSVEKIRMVGHKMKGSGASYGFLFVSDCGHAVEANATNRQKISHLLQELRKDLQRVEIHYI
ncbi:MAG: Hpt domain-containing protein [Spirochaetota bacterium]